MSPHGKRRFKSFLPIQTMASSLTIDLLSDTLFLSTAIEGCGCGHSLGGSG